MSSRRGIQLASRSLVSSFSRIRPSPPCLTRNASRQHLRSTPSRHLPSSQRRASTLQALRNLRKQHPVAVPAGLATILLGGCFLLYSAYLYMRYIAPINTKFPEPVANKLRRALYYSNQEVEPQKALRYYRQALALAEEHGMDPFSDEILGIKITVAAMLEKVGAHARAAEVLEAVRSDCEKWLDGTGMDAARRKDRTRVLGKTVGMGVKLAELYGSPYIRDPDAAEKNLVQSVETSLREQKRRDDEQVTEEEEGPWLNAEELGGALEQLAEFYASHDQHSLSAPLYLRALSLNPPPCHASVMMSNLALSLSQSEPASTDPGQMTMTSVAPTSKATLVSNARSWAEKALSIACEVKPPDRTEECDVGCVLATYNLGEFAEMEGLVIEANDRYTEAKALGRAIGYTDGEKQAEAGLTRIKNLKAKGG